MRGRGALFEKDIYALFQAATFAAMILALLQTLKGFSISDAIMGVMGAAVNQLANAAGKVISLAAQLI